MKGFCYGFVINFYCKFFDLKVSIYFLECYFSFIKYNIIKVELRIFFFGIINNSYLREGYFILVVKV